MAKSFADQMVELFDHYTKEFHVDKPDLKEVATWAVHSKLYDVPDEDKIRKCSKELQESLRASMHVSPSGRKMRTYQCCRQIIQNDEGKAEQRFIWADIRTVDPAFVAQSYRERHASARADIRALQSDIDSWNKDYRPEDVDPLSFPWDFSAMQDDEG